LKKNEQPKNSRFYLKKPWYGVAGGNILAVWGGGTMVGHVIITIIKERVILRGKILCYGVI